MTPDSPSLRALAFWDRLHETRDYARLTSIFEHDVVLVSPLTPPAYRGQREVGVVLRALLSGILQDFTLSPVILSDTRGALEFRARIGREPFMGVAMFRLSAAGKVAGIEVLMRSLSGMDALAGALRLRVLPLLIPAEVKVA